jgi:hypothetical protein
VIPVVVSQRQLLVIPLYLCNQEELASVSRLIRESMSTQAERCIICITNVLRHIYYSRHD